MKNSLCGLGHNKWGGELFFGVIADGAHTGDEVVIVLTSTLN